MFLRKSLFLLATGLLAVPAFSSNLQPGKYQVTVEMEMGDMKMPPTTVTQCISKEDAEKAGTTIQQTLGADGDCKLSDVKADGDTITYKVACPKKQISGDGTFHVAGETYDGTMHLNMAGSQMTQKFSGKRLGACD